MNTTLSTTIAFAGLLLALCLGIAPVHAAEAPTPEVRLLAWQVLAGAGDAAPERLRQLPPKVSPGDVLEYEARYINGTTRTLQNAQLTLPVPAGSAYVPGARTNTPIDGASVDGKRFEMPPLRREVRLPDGRLEMQIVPTSEIRFLRWNLGRLPAGAERTVRARIQLEPLQAANGTPRS